MEALNVMGPTLAEPAVKDIERPAGITIALLIVIELVPAFWAHRATLVKAACIVAGERFKAPAVAQLGDIPAARAPPPAVKTTIDPGSSSQSP